MVVTQLVERLLLTPEVCGLNPVIGKIYIEHCLPKVNSIEKTKIKKKEAGIGPFLRLSCTAFFALRNGRESLNRATDVTLKSN